ncbi:hypothetical protein [Spiroplasma endosymbiont of Virgichneumon dumeticola]|uniref:hypothetical protein n=1 Tax=Spiroplasma endosymbiont of Virgichneumon dumeticola TaxID=3139323 RepID=UPI0035C8C594
MASLQILEQQKATKNKKGIENIVLNQFRKTKVIEKIKNYSLIFVGISNVVFIFLVRFIYL